MKFLKIAVGVVVLHAHPEAEHGRLYLGIRLIVKIPVAQDIETILKIAIAGFF